MTSLLFAALLAAAPPAPSTTYRYVMDVADVPVAEMRVTVQGDRYDYAATHFFEEDPAERVVSFSLKALPAVPEVLALSTLDQSGCRDVFGEKRQKLEKLCVDAVRSSKAKGSIDGAEFIARYADGRLQEITVGTAHWRAISNDTPSAPPSQKENPFAKGVPSPANAAAFSPAFPAARWLTTTPTPSGTLNARARCLVLAKEAVKQKPQQRRVVVGLVLEGDRAYPHAWIAEGDQHFDPSLVDAVPGRRYVEVPRAESGTFYLSLFAGAVKLVPK
ncbi:MAG: hypothetical protein QM817_21920 [Archangium sp.]